MPNGRNVDRLDWQPCHAAKWWLVVWLGSALRPRTAVFDGRHSVRSALTCLTDFPVYFCTIIVIDCYQIFQKISYTATLAIHLCPETCWMTVCLFFENLCSCLHWYKTTSNKSIFTTVLQFVDTMMVITTVRMIKADNVNLIATDEPGGERALTIRQTNRVCSELCRIHCWQTPWRRKPLHFL